MDKPSERKLEKWGKMKKHIWLCDYERLWIKLSLLAILSGYFILQGSTLPVLVDNQIIKFLFVSDAQEIKLYIILLSVILQRIFLCYSNLLYGKKQNFKIFKCYKIEHA